LRCFSMPKLSDVDDLLTLQHARQTHVFLR